MGRFFVSPDISSNPPRRLFCLTIGCSQSATTIHEGTAVFAAKGIMQKGRQGRLAAMNICAICNIDNIINDLSRRNRILVGFKISPGVIILTNQ